MNAPQAIDTATRQLRRGQARQALDGLLDAWRAAPDPTVADCIDAISAWLAPVIPPLGDAPGAWMTLAAAGRSVDQPRLAEAAFAVGTERAMQLAWLNRQPADPRWSAPLIALFARGWTARNRLEARVGRRAFDALEALQDARSADRVRALHLTTRGYWRESLTDRVARLAVPTTPPTAALDAARAALIAALEATSPPSLDALRADPRGPTGDALRGVVEAEPDNLDARLIYADWLAQVGDPRAEFMRLQFAQAERPLDWAEARQHARLLEQHAEQWLGVLAPHVDAVDWRLGFPYAADLLTDDARILDAPAWRTLRAIRAPTPGLLAHPNLAGVEQLGRVGEFHGRTPARPIHPTVAARTPERIRRLVVASLSLPDLPQRLALDALTIVAPRRPYPLQPAIDRAHLGALTTLDVWNVNEHAWVAHFAALPRLRRLTIVPLLGQLRYALTRTDAGVEMEVVWMGGLPCPSLEPAAAIAAELDVARIAVATPFYRHHSEDLVAWVGAFEGRPVTLPALRD